MAFDFSKASGAGTDTIDSSVLGPPFLSIIQKGSPEFDETHQKYAEKRIDGCRPGNVVLESERVIIPQPFTVIPLVQFPHYVEWKANKAGLAGHRPLDIVSDPRYRKGTPGTQNEYKEYLGENELVLTILFVVLLEHEGQWKKAMIAFTNKQLKKARTWTKAILGLKLNGQPADVRAPIFAAKYPVKTVAESNAKGGWFGWEIGAAVPLDPTNDQALLEQAFEAHTKATLELPRTQSVAALGNGDTQVVEEAPY